MQHTFQGIIFKFIIAGGVFTIYFVADVWPDIDSAAPFLSRHPSINLFILNCHIAAAIPPLLIGWVSFQPGIRNNHLKLHRWVGRVYCVCVWISSVGGLALASANTRGTVAQFGFGTLATFWFTTTLMAYIAVRNKRFIHHRQWMIRSYALTLAVVTVRPLLWFGSPHFIEPTNWYLLVSWLCWVPNYLLAEIYIAMTTHEGRLRRFQKFY